MAPHETALRSQTTADGWSVTEASAERDLLMSALREAAPLALEHFRPGGMSTARSWRKSDGSSVTEADLAVNDALKRILLSARPDYGWLSEEDFAEECVADRLSRRRLFVLDPIDGTRSFMEGGEAFCLSVALVEDGAPVAGAVFAPAMGRMYDAAVGCGARLNGAAMAPILDPDAHDADGPVIMAVKRDLKNEHWLGGAPTAQRRYMQPIAHRLCSVAAGEAHGLVALKATHEWDIAAADLIAREAGLTTTDLAGRALRYNMREPLIPGLLVAPSAMHADWLARRPQQLARG